MAIYLSHSDVQSVITMPEVFQAVEEAFREHGLGTATNLARQHLGVPKGVYRSMSGGVPSQGGMGTKVGLHGFEVPPGVKRSHVVTTLYSTETGELLAVIWSDLITDYRTGAMGGVSAKYLARADAEVVGVIGSGRQARAQLMAVAQVRPLRRAWVFSPNREHRRSFANEMSEQLGLEIKEADDARTAVEHADVVVAATNSSAPVFDGNWVKQGTHVISIGASRKADVHDGAERREIDDRSVERSGVITVDSLEQGFIQEAPEVFGAMKEGHVVELGAVVAGRQQGRASPEQITLFKSFGMAIHDVAAAAKVYERAMARGLGLKLPWP